jgi:hypothetical protein
MGKYNKHLISEEINSLARSVGFDEIIERDRLRDWLESKGFYISTNRLYSGDWLGDAVESGSEEDSGWMVHEGSSFYEVFDKTVLEVLKAVRKDQSEVTR